MLPGDLVRRTTITDWWIKTCRAYGIKIDDVYTVKSIEGNTIYIKELPNVGIDFTMMRIVKSVDNLTPIEHRIKKLYAKCKTTVHWTK